ncbi:MAG TPA: hypothetical protein VGB50_07430 [Flavobacterium sp.]|jgi:hypothetical protein
MDIVEILLATVAGTSLMTGFSYLVSEASRELYKEPLLLNIIMKKLGVELQGAARTIAAWLLHYFIGLLFVLGYELAWKYTALGITWMCALLFGIVSGIAGILGWMVIFRLPENPPQIPFKTYYLQLFFAHIIFAFTVIAVYKLYS